MIDTSEYYGGTYPDSDEEVEDTYEQTFDENYDDWYADEYHELMMLVMTE